MKDIVFIADAFYEDIPQGGAELVNHLLIQELQKNGFCVEKILSFKINDAFFEAKKDSFFIVSSFLAMPANGLEALKKQDYVLYEHDHKYHVDRNPALYQDYKIPKNKLVYQDLYNKAQSVICQSSLHADILLKNMPSLNSVINAGCSVWDSAFLHTVKQNLKSNPKNTKAAIMLSDNPIKGQKLAEQYCIDKNIEYELISAPSPEQLFKKLLDYEYFVFFPETPETFSRVFMEAKLAGCKVITNSLIGASYENYTFSDREKLFEEVEGSLPKLTNLFINEVNKNKNPHSKDLFYSQRPKVSIITSVYNGSEFIEQFMSEITKQTNFEFCELIMVDCNCGQSDTEKDVIKKYQKKYDNIFYYELDEDPGVYGAWNFGIKKSKGSYITNANLDDRRAYDMIDKCVRFLEYHKHVDLTYPAFFVTDQPNETFYTSRSRQVYESHDFTPQLMHKCLPGCMPLWRKSLHEKNGYFNKEYFSAGDLEFWLRCVDSGSEFKRIPQILGLYYFNPKGVSTNPENNEKKIKEEQKILMQYSEMFQS